MKDNDIDKIILENIKKNGTVTKNVFRNMVISNPNLIGGVNQKLKGLGQEIFNNNDMVNICEEFLVKQMLNQTNEIYLNNIFINLANNYLDIKSNLLEKITILNTDKTHKLNFIIDFYSRKFKDIPRNFIEQAKRFYLTDKRDYSELCNVMKQQLNKIEAMEYLTSKDIDPVISSHSIIMIGPMGTGKSTISNKLSNSLHMPKVSLDNSQQLKFFYDQKEKFENFKDFEFYLTSSVLTNIQEPSIIDFGAGHSVYENPLMFYEMQKLVKKFNNVILMIPSKDKNESLQILNERVRKRNKSVSEETLNDNKHFIFNDSNYKLATIVEYTKDKTIDDISNDLIKKIGNNLELNASNLKNFK